MAVLYYDNYNRTHLLILSFSILFFSFSSRLVNSGFHGERRRERVHGYHYDELNNFSEDQEGGLTLLSGAGYDPEAHPSFLSSINGDRDEEFTEAEPSVLSFKGIEDLRSAKPRSVIFNVDDFGAEGDGIHDDTQVFEEAWEKACSYKGPALFLVPERRTYLIGPIRFLGPCKSNLVIQISGTILASDNRSDYRKDPRHWIVIDSVDNLLVEGGGTIHGNGQIWWRNSCKINKSLPCKEAPTAVTFYKCKNLMVRNVKVQDAQQMQVSFEKCSEVTASDLTVTAPEKSPNTDGIHVTNTQNILITNTFIGTGDDCISIESGSHNVQIEELTCGPGHGISIGSLGDNNSKAFVSFVTVNGAKLSGTTNGVRIKTYQGGSGSASNIKFQNVDMENVKNPIIIDQNYCDQKKPCKKQKSAVQVKDVLYQNIQGNSASDVAIDFDCSENYPCLGVKLQNVRLQRADRVDEEAKAICNHVELTETGVVFPRCPDYHLKHDEL
ncbi:polygalacturonase-like isoform X2 [Carica papaya]|uniref:polygalacturonase-like isoform X2 n=1 Tax=Carica papaya TaxID=3649 RepID=UPI000B8CF5C0|nr:polygalacturonase-like isoform X2 [Carica papaya]